LAAAGDSGESALHRFEAVEYAVCVMKLEEIKSVIGQLSPRERAELNAWLQDWADDD
jgi:hypothetical protein